MPCWMKKGDSPTTALVQATTSECLDYCRWSLSFTTCPVLTVTLGTSQLRAHLSGSLFVLE